MLELSASFASAVLVPGSSALLLVSAMPLPRSSASFASALPMAGVSTLSASTMPIAS